MANYDNPWRFSCKSPFVYPSNCPLASSPKPLVLRSGIHCLDCPGMPLVNPHIVRWETSKILRWSETCHKHCITNLPIPWTLTTPIQVKSTLVESLPRSHLTTCCSRKTLVSRQPPSYLPINHGTARLTCCLVLYSPRVVSFHCTSRSTKPWRVTSRRLSNRSSSDLPSPKWH